MSVIAFDGVEWTEARSPGNGKLRALALFSVQHADGTSDTLRLALSDPPADADELRSQAWSALAQRLRRYASLGMTSADLAA